MARWVAHRATFICYHHAKTARARRSAAMEGRAPLCPTCRLPMNIQDIRGLTDKACADLAAARRRQIDALSTPSTGG